MAKFRKCEDCENCDYDYADGFLECCLFGFSGMREDKKGNEGCYRSDKTLNKYEELVKKELEGEE